ncbi:MAG: M28 family peptidase [Pyrinomonadaceae bacterium]
MRKNIFAFLLISTFLLQSAFAQTANLKVTPVERKVAEGVTAKQLSDYLYFVASDAMAGRDTPSQGLNATAEFLKMNLSRWGFKPAGDNGTFFQKMAMTRESFDPAATSLEIGGQSFTFNEDFYRIGGTGPANGPVVFGKDGWMVKSKNIDAFAGVDVAGKIVVLSSPGFSQSTIIPMPNGVTQDDLKGEVGVDWASPFAYAQKKGAAAVIMIAPPELKNVWQSLRSIFGRGGLYVDKLREVPADLSDIPTFLVSEKVGDAIFAGETGNKTSTSAFATSKTGKLIAASKSVKLMTQNVVAIWEGSDAVLKNEMVAIGAHYDHVGTNQNAPGEDKIWNGADDDGSGTVSVLSIAEALAKAPKRPKRSVLFVWHAGEEKGLWGAEYFNKFPTVDIKQVIAQLNIDMIGRSRKAGDTNPKNKDLTDENSTYVIGSEMMSSTLGSVVKQANSGFLNLRYDYKYDDPKDEERFFFRSDHFHYAVNGIPVAFWFSGVHEDYHQPGDEAHKIDYNKLEKIARTIFVTLLKLADLKERPKIDKQLPPELTQR